MHPIRSAPQSVGRCVGAILLLHLVFLSTVWADDRRAAWFAAVQENNASGIKRLLDAGVDVNLKDEIGQTALMQACSNGARESAALLLEKGVAVNAADAVGGTALMYACMSGNSNLVALLLGKGADVGTRDVMDNTALVKASARGHDAVVELMLEKGANVNEQGAYGMTALMWAVSLGDADFVRLLLKNGADVNIFANGGVAPLMIAAGPVWMEQAGQYGSVATVAVRGGNVEVLRILLANGADLHAKDVRGKTVLAYAGGRGGGKEADLLVSQSAP